LMSRRISAGFGLALCAFLLFEHARLGRMQKGFGYGAAAFLAATVVFAIDGRTGHLVLLVLLCCAAFRAAPRRAGIAAAAGAVIVAVLLGALSQPLRDRVAESVHGLRSGLAQEAGPATSTRIRFEIWQTAAIVAGENLMLGVGWGHYAQAAEEASRRRHADPRLVAGAQSDNPHSEYLMQIAGGGVPALLLFLLWVAWPVWAAARAGRAANHGTGTLACVALAFAIAAMFNSLLMDFMEAHLYAALASWLLVRGAEN
ncbi:MAG TPA: O-antigen ligase family protein, partial [Ramlibacter sp.]|nr:O-antigen ligase family protein [Ramlibacter sp.]